MAQVDRAHIRLAEPGQHFLLVSGDALKRPMTFDDIEAIATDEPAFGTALTALGYSFERERGYVVRDPDGAAMSGDLTLYRIVR